MSRRFNNLDAALKYLRPPGANEGSVVPDAPANTALRRYQDFKAGKTVLTYNRAPESRPGKINLVALQPFSNPETNTDLYASSFSNRAGGKFSTFALTATLLGQAAVNGDTIRARGYVPAKAVCLLIGDGVGTVTPSKITGVPYRKKNAETATFPFGSTTANKSYSAQKSAITAAVAGLSTNASVSFLPEKF